MLLSDSTYKAPKELKALVANYPVCWAYNNVEGYKFSELRKNIKLLIISGNKDLYDNPKTCDNLVNKLPKKDRKKVKLLQLNNATHGFDSQQKESYFYDPYACLGNGCNVPIIYNISATKIAVSNILTFFTKNLIPTK